MVQVEHKDPVLKYTATGTAGGEDFTETETINTDGRPTTDSRGMQIKARWEGRTLVIESTGAGGRLLDSTRLTIANDRKAMVREYERRSDTPQKRHEIYEKR